MKQTGVNKKGEILGCCFILVGKTQAWFNYRGITPCELWGPALGVRFLKGTKQIFSE